MEKKLLRIDEVAQMVGLGRTSVYQLVAAGTIRSVRIGRSRRVPVEAVNEFIRGLETDSETS